MAGAGSGNSHHEKSAENKIETQKENVENMLQEGGGDNISLVSPTEDEIAKAEEEVKRAHISPKFIHWLQSLFRRGAAQSNRVTRSRIRGGRQVRKVANKGRVVKRGGNKAGKSGRKNRTTKRGHKGGKNRKGAKKNKRGQKKSENKKSRQGKR
jgi:hypothetical protein